ARYDRPPKTRFFDTRKQNEFLIAILDLTQRQHGANLGQRFDNQHTGHHRRAGKVALKERLVDTHLLDADDSFARNELYDSVNEEKRVAVRQELLNSQCVENCFHLAIKATKKHKNYLAKKSTRLFLCLLCLFVALLRRRRGRRCGYRIFTVEVGNERARDVDIVRGVQQRYLRSVDNHVDATRFGKGFERFANLVLQRQKEFLATTIVVTLSVLTFTLNVFFQLVQLIDLGLQGALIDRRSF